MAKVICIHIGARAHYLLPKAIQASGKLHGMITDTWIGSSLLRSILIALPIRSLRALAGRHSEDIPSSNVQSLGLYFLVYDFYLRFKYSYSWTLIIARDKKFEHKAVQKMNRITGATTVCAISYTALECFKAARQKSLKTVLFQVDPGLEEEHIVRELVSVTNTSTDWEPAPTSYWERWKEECRMSDVIMVNSLWSKVGLVKQGIEADKIQVIPLPFNVEQRHEQFKRTYASVFSIERPLRCLFLGTLALRKGIHLVLEAASNMQDLPIEFILVGRSEIPLSEIDLKNISYKGVVTREETEHYYQQADVFLFPTLSDGFGLTQLESMAWQLPVIATKNCGEVVQDAYNGWLIDPVNTEQLIVTLKTIIKDSDQIKLRSQNCLSTVKQFSVEKFTTDIAALL